MGILTYLITTTRPDLAFVVHQCARFSKCPKLIHEQAIKRICRYLKGTTDEGIMLNIDESKEIECYTDDNFAGGWNKETTTDPTLVSSRTGYISFYKECPMTWKSKIQTEISLSTTEV